MRLNVASFGLFAFFIFSILASSAFAVTMTGTFTIEQAYHELLPEMTARFTQHLRDLGYNNARVIPIHHNLPIDEQGLANILRNDANIRRLLYMGPVRQHSLSFFVAIPINRVQTSAEQKVFALASIHAPTMRGGRIAVHQMRIYALVTAHNVPQVEQVLREMVHNDFLNLNVPLHPGSVLTSIEAFGRATRLRLPPPPPPQ